MVSFNNNDNRYHKIVNLLETCLSHLFISHKRLENLRKPEIRVLRFSERDRMRIIIKINRDEQLLISVESDMVELDNGCICCTINDLCLTHKC